MSLSYRSMLIPWETSDSSRHTRLVGMYTYSSVADQIVSGIFHLSTEISSTTTVFDHYTPGVQLIHIWARPVGLTADCLGVTPGPRHGYSYVCLSSPLSWIASAHPFSPTPPTVPSRCWRDLSVSKEFPA